MKKLFIYCCCLFAPALAWAQTPPDNLLGAQLQTWIKQNYYDGKHIDLGYNEARSQMYGYIDKAADGKIECVYTGFKQDGGFVTFPDPINAEHTVPQSFFGELFPMKADLNHLFPTHMDPNAARGIDKFMDIADAPTTDWWIDGKKSQGIPTSNIDAYSEDTGSGFEPRESHKGNVARAVFYFFTVYPTEAGAISGVADVNLLYQWHLNDPVDAAETTRNARVKEKQGNGNPFIENPDWVFKAWKQTGTTGTQAVAIKTLRDAIDADGKPTTAGEVEVSGIFHGANLNPGTNRFQFSLIDATGAITVRNGGTDLGIAEFAEGDEVTVKGTLSSFRGLMQIAPTSITRTATGKARVAPKTVTALDEVSESYLVKMQNVKIVDKTQWKGLLTYSGSGFTVKIEINGAVSDMRIDKNTELAKMTYDEVFGTDTEFNIIGLGGQYDADNIVPFNIDYQFLPYKKSDITKFVAGTATPIKKIRDAVDADGKPTTPATEIVEVKGILHGVNINPGSTPDPNNFQFSLIDETGAITIRNTKTTANPTDFGILGLAEGDEVTVKGTVSNFRGLMQIAPTAITRHAQGLPRVTPKTVTVLNEVSESDLVKMMNVKIVDKTKWLGSATYAGSGFTVSIEANGAVWLMRIDKSTELAKMTYADVFGPDTDGFTIVGLGGQFGPASNATPPLIYNSDYQFLPYKKSDISLPINFKAEFADPGIAVLEHEGTFEVGVKISKAMTTDQTITVSAVNVSASEADYTTSPALAGGKITLNIPAGQTSANFSVSIIDDTETEALEFLEFEIAGATGGGVIGTQKIFEVDIYDNDVKDFTPIANIRKNDAAGEPEMLLNFVKIAGLVYGKNTHPAAGTVKREFTVISSAGRAGILARYDGATDLAYTVAEGDSIVITGEIDIMEGMTVIVPFKIEKMASSKKILDPRIVTGLIGEKEESDLIKLKTVTVVSGWGAIKNGGYDVVITDGARDYRMRIDAASGLVGTAKPGTFNVVGLGAQKDMDAIYDDFYSIKPRAASDIQILTASEAGIEGVTVKMYPNPASSSFTVEASGLSGSGQLLMFNAIGEKVYEQAFHGSAQVEVYSLQNGVYFVKIATEKGFAVQRIVIGK